uniref:HEPN domain-containing protein n=1 Tax=uncultured Dysgonomonas sp. TaxID=206096 RepID=UPI00260505F1|nr:HEPN domain-containing protein [uncultured Dysgonomonas sp.]
MKKSISHLPKARQEDIYYLVSKIRQRLPEVQMIILYGSYATGKYVEYDERMEFGIPTAFMSDYDILVVIGDGTFKKVQQGLDNIEALYYKKPETQAPVQFILDDIKILNRQLEEGRYFYTQLKKEGIVLYDSGKFKLARRRKLNFKEIQEQAQEYFEDKFNRGNSFLADVKNAYNREDYKQASFYLHQASENYYHSIRLATTLRSTKQHNLDKLATAVRRYSKELALVFPRDTEEEKRLFELLKAAYIEARYNSKFLVTKEDIEALIPKVELLRDITKRICEQKIQEYGEME